MRDGSKEEVLSYFQGIHPRPHQMLDRPTSWKRWATADREPVEHWGQGRVTLLGDAAHPMTQYMAQGACMALEDAVTLGEAVRACGHDLEAAFRRYESVRIPRSARGLVHARDGPVVSRARRRTHRAQFAVDRPQPVPVPGRVAMALRLESGAMPRGTHPAIKTGTGGDDMKHASTRGAVRIAATPAAGACAARRVAASASRCWRCTRTPPARSKSPWTSASSARCPRLHRRGRARRLHAGRAGRRRQARRVPSTCASRTTRCRPTPSRAPTGWCRAACACSPA